MPSSAERRRPLVAAPVADPQRDPEHRAAVRTLKVLAAAVVAVMVGVVVLVVATLVDDEPSREGVDRDVPVDAPTPSDEPVRAIGPEPGVQVGEYVASRSRVLGAAAGDRLAVVSFDRYLTADEADARSWDGLERVALLVAPTGGQAEVVADPVDEWAARTRAAAVAERDEIEGIAPTVDEPEFRGFYEDELARLALVAEGTDAAAPVVFGAVVRGSGDALRRLASADDVRLVDVAAGPEAAARADYRGIRPEESEVVGEPEFRPPDP